MCRNAWSGFEAGGHFSTFVPYVVMFLAKCKHVNYSVMQTAMVNIVAVCFVYANSNGKRKVFFAMVYNFT